MGIYRHNFNKGKDGKYVNLDFAYLDDLAILAMRFRKILLNISLDLEYSVSLSNDVDKEKS